MPRPSAKDRARAYIAKAAPAAIEGQRGDDTTYAVACALVIEFGLNEGDAWDLLLEYNRLKCSPPWSEPSLAGKLRSARNMAAKKPGEIGRLIDQDRNDYAGPRAPTNTAANASAPKPPSQAPPQAIPSAARTLRTPLFPVHRFGEGAKPRTVRTLRTLPAYSFTQTPTTQPVCIDSGRVSEVSVIKAPHVSANQLQQPRQTVQTLADQARESGHDLTWCENATGRCIRYDVRGAARLIGMMAKDRDDK